jgi:purine-nucleoside phosphorylase
MRKRVLEAAEYIKSATVLGSEPAKTAIILGTGLGSLGEEIDELTALSYNDIPGFPTSTAPSHKGRLLTGMLNGSRVVVLQGRFHYYEGYSMEQVTFPVRVLKELGIKQLIVTNASGSLNQNLQQGDIVLISDHINFMGVNPLIGNHEPYQGERFPSMHQPYSLELIDKAVAIAKDNNIKLQKGVYLAVSGPSLETVSECRAFASWGADLVGMSTVPEVIVAVQCNLEVLCLSVVTNMSNLFHRETHEQEDIQETAKKALARIRVLIERLTDSR